MTRRICEEPAGACDGVGVWLCASGLLQRQRSQYVKTSLLEVVGGDDGHMSQERREKLRRLARRSLKRTRGGANPRRSAPSYRSALRQE